MDAALLLGGGIALTALGGIALYPAARVIPFAYGSARVRAARARMFTDAELSALAGEWYKDVVYHLERRGMTGLLDLIDEDFREELVEKRLRQAYLQELAKLTGYVPGRYRKFFRVLQMRLEFDFILAVLRSKSNPYYERHIIEDLFVETANFTAADLAAIEEMPLDDFVSRLKGTPHYALVAARLEEIRAGELAAFELELNHHYLTQLRRSATDGPLRAYADLSVDLYNIRHALCFRDSGFFTEGGTLSEGVLKDLEDAKTVAHVLDALKRTRYNQFMADVTSVAGIERGLLRAQKDFATRLLKSDAIGIGQILSYYIHKRIELKNIQVLLKLVSEQFPPEEIREALA